jgi:cysteine desulfurase NifS/selenium donor protein
MKAVYLDYNATTPIDPEVIEAMEPFLRNHFGNPSSSHSFGATTRSAVEKARKQVAGLLGAKSYEIIFTSGGTESNNLAVQGVAFSQKSKGRHIITSSIEHPAIMEVCKHLEGNGFRITHLPVDSDGMVDPLDVRKAIMPDTILITIMHANNEVGTIQPIKEISQIAKEHKILFHTDAAQSVGKTVVDINDLGVDLLSVAGHKLYAPKGVGALYVREGVELGKFIHGADHEQNIRPGTENVLEIVGLGKACEIAGRDLEKNIKHLKSTRDSLKEGLLADFPQMKVNGHPEFCLPNTLNVSFPGLEANTILGSLENLAASAGAACHVDQVDLSPVLVAMGIPVETAMGTIRLSTGKYTSLDEIESAVEELGNTVRSLSPSDNQPVERVNIGEIKLTHFTHGLGCACKLRPQDLETVLKDMPIPKHPNVLVGLESSDDAAIYKINDDTAIVQTVDFFTPVVDDPYHFGAITAANSLSDIYAMGGEPLFALNIVAFPSKRLPLETLSQILKGAQDKATEAGLLILGGHTIEDNEPKYGLAVTGKVHPDKIWKNNTAQAGDIVVLTKAIGTGFLSTALKRGLLSEDQTNILVEHMSRLNKGPADILKGFEVNAVTDVTGFGLLGHFHEITGGSGVDAEIWVNEVPVMDGVKNILASNIIPGGTINNLDFIRKHLILSPDISKNDQLILADAQTSGGLLFTIPEKEVEALREAFGKANENFFVVGKMRDKGRGSIYLLNRG